MTATAVCRLGGGCDDLDHGSATGVLRQCRLIQPHLSFQDLTVQPTLPKSATRVTSESASECFVSNFINDC